MKNFSKVFRFTLTNLIKAKSYIALTVVFAIIFAAAPAGLMPLFAYLSSDDDVEAEQYVEYEDYDYTYYVMSDGSMYVGSGAENVYCVSEDGCLITAEAVCSYANRTGIFGEAEFTVCEDDEQAEILAGERDIILKVSEDENSYYFYACRTENSVLDEWEAESIAMFLSSEYVSIVSDIMGVSYEDAQKAYIPISYSFTVGDDEAEEEDSVAYEVLSYVVPYLNIMIVYFLVLFYAQGTANSVIAEKTSKLMDTFLISVKAEDMVIGKIVAICTAAIIQFFIWLASFAAGTVLGYNLVLKYYPESGITLKTIVGYLGDAAENVSVMSFVVGAAIIIAGFFLYSSLSAFGGAMASKPEDLGVTNQLFTIALLISFFAVLLGGLDGDMAHEIMIFDIIPFTAMMLTPARLLLGYIPAEAGLISLAISVLLSLGIGYAAGRVFRFTAFRRGDPPKISEIGTIVKKAFGNN